MGSRRLHLVQDPSDVIYTNPLKGHLSTNFRGLFISRISYLVVSGRSPCDLHPLVPSSGSPTDNSPLNTHQVAAHPNNPYYPPHGRLPSHHIRLLCRFHRYPRRAMVHRPCKHLIPMHTSKSLLQRLLQLRAIPTVGGTSFPGLSYLGALRMQGDCRDVLEEGYKKACLIHLRSS